MSLAQHIGVDDAYKWLAIQSRNSSHKEGCERGTSTWIYQNRDSIKQVISSKSRLCHDKFEGRYFMFHKWVAQLSAAAQAESNPDQDLDIQ